MIDDIMENVKIESKGAKALKGLKVGDKIQIYIKELMKSFDDVEYLGLTRNYDWKENQEYPQPQFKIKHYSSEKGKDIETKVVLNSSEIIKGKDGKFYDSTWHDDLVFNMEEIK